MVLLCEWLGEASFLQKVFFSIQTMGKVDIPPWSRNAPTQSSLIARVVPTFPLDSLWRG